MDKQPSDREEILRLLLQRSIDQERMLMDNDQRLRYNEQQDRIHHRRNRMVNIVYTVFMVGCLVTFIAGAITANNVQSGKLRPEPSTQESPIYFTP